MNFFKINILLPDTKVSFAMEEKHFESMGECLDFYIKKYPNYDFEIKEYEMG